MTTEPMQTDAIAMTGLERVRGYVGKPTPGDGMGRLLGMRLVAAEFGTASVTATPSDAHINPHGTVHGGYITSLLDTALGIATLTVLGPGAAFTTLELKVSFQSACRPDGGEVTAQGTVGHRGRRVVFAEARLTDGSGRVLATASSTLLVLAGAPVA